MARFVDTPLEAGNAANAVTALNAAVTSSGNTQTTQQRTETQTSQTEPRFAGKSTEEIVQMYKNLESHSGRLASQLGENKAMLNQLILGKRQDDLRQNGGNTTPVEIKPTDLLANPTEAIDRYLRSRETPMVSQLQERLNQLESQLGQTTFVSKHKDADAVTADPAFAAWVQQTPLRMRLAAEAAQNNYYSADLLLTEWNSSQTAGNNTVSNAQNRAQELAKGLRLEGNNTGSEGAGRSGSVRQFKRADLIALRQSDPDKYESPAFQREIVKAYQEGRVVD